MKHLLPILLFLHQHSRFTACLSRPARYPLQRWSRKIGVSTNYLKPHYPAHKTEAIPKGILTVVPSQPVDQRQHLKFTGFDERFRTACYFYAYADIHTTLSHTARLNMRTNTESYTVGKLRLHFDYVKYEKVSSYCGSALIRSSKCLIAMLRGTINPLPTRYSSPSFLHKPKLPTTNTASL